jgi:hypothetical protein
MSLPEWLTSIEPVDPDWNALADRVAADPWLRPGWFRG